MDSLQSSIHHLHVREKGAHTLLGVHLENFLHSSRKNMKLVGVRQASSLALLVTHQLGNLQARPQVFVFPTEKESEQFQADLKFFAPHIPTHYLPKFDVSPYSGLYPNKRTLSLRLNWLFRAQNPSSGELFVTSLESLLQKTLPFSVLAKASYKLTVGEDLPSSPHEFLEKLGYSSTPLVEDVGQYAFRGGILDVYSPAHPFPVRLELFGDTIEALRFFDPETGRNRDEIEELDLIPTSEILYADENRQQVVQKLKSAAHERPVEEEELSQIQRDIVHRHHFPGSEFLLPYFYPEACGPLEHFSQPVTLWCVDPEELAKKSDELFAELSEEYKSSEHLSIRPHPSELYQAWDRVQPPGDSQNIEVLPILLQDFAHPEDTAVIEVRVDPLKEFIAKAKSLSSSNKELFNFLQEKIQVWREAGEKVFISAAGSGQIQRLKILAEHPRIAPQDVFEEDYDWSQWSLDQESNPYLVHLIPRPFTESFRLPQEGFVFLSGHDLFGQKALKKKIKEQGSLDQRVGALSFSDLKVGDLVVHKTHGIGVYDGLKVMPIQGVDAEFIQLKYKDNDKLYLPVYRIGQIQKYSGPSTPALVDKLGGQGWEKTKTKVRNHLRDIANDLLKLYAQRSQMERPAFSPPDKDFLAFEAAFPYEETQDQLRAIHSLVEDMTSTKPMDRLICGDVGFGKTEIAMRAAFKAVQDGRQVCVIAPTTVLTFQHIETFKKRFKSWPVTIKGLNRFVKKSDQAQTLKELKEGKVDIIIGTHRLLSKDVFFKNLGLLIIDEEQKFGVRHKERLRKLKASVDTLALSATPIPRTLHMSLMGIRDLSIINTPPIDRLPTRTFVCKFDGETIKKAVDSELARGGQVFFIHNRVNSIYALADELRNILPNVRMRVAHGQMPEDELEKAMVAFFNHEVDVLLCTTIIESGMDIPRANTMFIDQAHQLGLSQLYQLRGRVGRSKERAYCYLLIPKDRKLDKDAQERLKVIQENTALGSGFKIAHYDLELRGAGDILGENQSGHINAVGYELYLELLEEEVRASRGEPPKQDVEPEINVRIPALIPDKYIPDLRIRLAYYKALSDIESVEEIDRIEDELRDQFGKPPDEVINLMGLMLIRKLCKDLGIRDLSSGPKSISLAFTESTPLTPERAIELASRPNKKYQITPDNRINIRINEITWPRILEELQLLI